MRPLFPAMLVAWASVLTMGLGYLVVFVRKHLPRITARTCAQIQRNTIAALAMAINAKDGLTFDHVRRVQIYAVGLGRLVGCSALELEALTEGALLHDVGKIGVSDAILTKRGKLTVEEFEQMKQHTILGADILSRIDFDFPIVPVVRSHHERWDGTGYPDGLKGETIPLTARVLSIVDCFDALREDRCYRKGMSRDEAIGLVVEGSGTFYDPKLVVLFLTHLPSFEATIRAERDYKAIDFGVPGASRLAETARLTRPAAGVAESMQ